MDIFPLNNAGDSLIEAQKFAQNCQKQDKKFVDLSKAIKQQLLTAGLEERNIQLPHLCTCGDKVKFFSYRLDHTKDALLTFIYRP